MQTLARLAGLFVVQSSLAVMMVFVCLRLRARMGWAVVSPFIEPISALPRVAWSVAKNLIFADEDQIDPIVHGEFQTGGAHADGPA